MKTMLVAAVVGALGMGAAVLGPAAEAAPSASPFAGEYTGQAVEPFESVAVAITSSAKVPDAFAAGVSVRFVSVQPVMLALVDPAVAV